MKLLKLLNKNHCFLYLVLVLSAIFRIMFFNFFNRIWWDSAIYIGMAKYFFSFGQAGIFEGLRPMLYPFILGMFWKININPVFIGKILVFAASLFCIYLVYKIAIEVFDKRTAIISAVFMAIAPTFLFFGFKILTDVLSLCFSLFAVYFFIKKKPVLVGMFCALAFLTRLTHAAVFAIIILIYIITIVYYFLNKKQRYIQEIKHLVFSILLFAIITAPYFIFSYIKTGSFFGFMKAASDIIHHVGKTLHEPWHYYFLYLLIENFLIVFAIIAIIALLVIILKSLKRSDQKKFNQTIKYSLLILLALLPFIYHSYLARKEPRYMLIFLPFLLILAARGLYYFHDVFKKKKTRHALRYVFYIALAILVVYSLSLTFTVYETPYSKQDLYELDDYFHYFTGSQDIILASGPELVFFIDKIQPIYSIQLNMYESFIEFDNIALNTCEMFCPSDDAECIENKNRFIFDIKQNYKQEFYTEISNCEYYIFTRS